MATATEVAPAAEQTPAATQANGVATAEEPKGLSNQTPVDT
jgi:hypothetical protein